jgi:DNA-binding LacI/PurR family transcriptional regulator
MLGVVFSVGHAFHGELVDGIYAAVVGTRYEVVLSGVTRRRDEDEAVRALLAERCEGLLLLGPLMRAAELSALAARVPTVATLRDVRAPGVDVVRTDDAAGVQQAVEHLHGLGHNRVAHVDGGRAPGAAQRRRGFHTALRRLGLGEGLVVTGGLTEEDGARAGQELRQRPARQRPTAVVAFNDRCALGVIDELRRGGSPCRRTCRSSASTTAPWPPPAVRR